ncbi:hypothetical protein SCUCBS95973_000354 [Sporothrix curviconia]|uniref:Zn(2)-C6 fungal-type domain-containing protein n=1 Tax=Sporothrix curviconia TaxID=1260050 RepID=A0ABP0APK9_9PEZI
MSSQLTHRRGAPRLYHKKSRLGCLRCKARRVKCDETHPSCSGCSRHLVECVYPVLGGPAGGQISVPLRPGHGDTFTAPTTGTGVGSRTRRRSRAAEAPTSAAASSSGIGNGTSLPDDERFLVSGYQAAEPGLGPDSLESLDPAESRARRLTELRLLHHYLLQQSWTFGQPTISRPDEAGSGDGQDPFIWAIDLVGRAIEGDGHDCILYVLLAHSALSLWVGGSATGGDRKEDREARAANRLLHQQYLALALRAQRRAVAALLASASSSSSSPVPASPQLGASDDTSSTVAAQDVTLQLADAVGTASVLLVNHSFALVQTLPLEPWQPPHEWLQMGRGAMQVMEVAKGYLGDSLAREKKRREDMAMATTVATGSGWCTPNITTPGPSLPSRGSKGCHSLVAKLLLASPRFDRADMFSHEWAAPHLWLLEEPVADPTADPAKGTRGADGDDEFEYDDGAGGTSFAPYYATLSYIGWCAAAIARPDEPINAICRRLAGAAYWFPGALEERLRQRRPRAMPLSLGGPIPGQGAVVCG